MADACINALRPDLAQGLLEDFDLLFDASFVVACALYASCKMGKAALDRDVILIVLEVGKIVDVKAVSSEARIDLDMYSRTLARELVDIP